jgi:hypothetical protein
MDQSIREIDYSARVIVSNRIPAPHPVFAIPLNSEVTETTDSLDSNRVTGEGTAVSQRVERW